MQVKAHLRTCNKLCCGFSIGTFFVNITGCFIIGFLIGLTVRFVLFENQLRLLLVIGFCGGYTTFSTLFFVLLPVLSVFRF
ncbi:MAG: CrcB family protein [Proteiniphilum sp.]|uniref:fluoride efflux transporter FluC n=1 Tax=Proteiniphilum sp. TaxID=1926877 RepID=UPI002B1F08EF|nr:CrcB family protein [Proteiniphilum sp.]MEA5129782.1 CrcB family protein [Proteiniphilum sp.]